MTILPTYRIVWPCSISPGSGVRVLVVACALFCTTFVMSPARGSDSSDVLTVGVDQASELIEAGEFNAAILLLEALREAEGEHPEITRELGRVYRDLGLWDTSIRFYRESLALDPGSADSWAGLGIVYFEAHQSDSSRVALGHALELDPNRTDAVGYLGELALETEDYAGARRHFERRLDLEGETFDALNDLAVVHQRSKNWDQARTLLERATLLYPELPQAQYHLAILEAQAGRFHEAVLAANRALQVDPEHLDTLRFLGVLYFENQVCTEAIRYFEQLLLVIPIDREVRIGLASCLHALGETDRAVLELKTLSNHLGEDYDLLLLIADFRLEQGRLDDALQMALRALSIDEARPDAHYLLGLTYRRMGQEEQARKEFERLDVLREAERMAESELPPGNESEDSTPSYR